MRAKNIFLMLSLLFSTCLYAQPHLSEIRLALSKPDCIKLLTKIDVNPKSKSVFNLSAKHGEFHLLEYSSLIIDQNPSKNTFYILSNDLTNIKNFEKIKQKINIFLEKLPRNTPENWNNNGMLIQTINEGGEEILVILYRIEDKFAGFISKLRNESQEIDEKHLDSAFKKAKEKLNINQLCWYGENTDKIEIYKTADKYGLEVLRRSPYVDTELPIFISNSNPIQNQELTPSSCTAFNCIPTSKTDLIYAGFSPDNSAAWEKFKANIDESIKDKFIIKSNSHQEFRDEVINGTNDVLLMVAHSDKISIYLGDKKIDIDEIKNWEDRQIQATKPRIAILLSCYSGEIAQQKTNWFFIQAQKESLSELLLKKKYFDYIVSPSHQISSDETLQVIQELLKNPSVKNLRSLFNGWHAFVFVEPKN